jgi:CSLREA domain-containing protein
VAVCCILCSAAPALGNTITVTTTQDEVNPNDGQCSLREAVMVADNPGNPMDCGSASQSTTNTIILGAHTYSLTIPHASDDGSSGHLAMFTIRTLTIQGAGPATVIDAGGLHDRVVNVVPGASAALRDLTLSGGHAPDGTTGTTGSAGGPSTNGGDGGAGTDGGDGGGIQDDGTLTLDHVIVSNNQAGNGGAGGPGGQGYGGCCLSHAGNGGMGGAGGRGGGIFNDGQLTIIDSTITGNHAGTGGAGGLGGPPGTPAGYYGGKGGPGGASGDGGAVASVGSGTALTVIDSTITGNFAGAGGDGGAGGHALDMIGTYKGGDGNNGADGGLGGGISGVGSATSILNSTVVANTAGDGGAAGPGGIGWPLSTDNLGNPGSYGAGGDGGGLRIKNPDSALLASDTIAGNAASAAQFETPGQAGGVWLESPVTLRDMLLTSNAPGGNCGTDTGTVASEFLNGGHNLSFGDLSCPNAFAAGDPKLGALKFNGGPTRTMAPGAGSAAKDAGGTGCPATDQRGVARPSGAACDIGAYELAPPTIRPGAVTQLTPSGATVTDQVLANQTEADAHFQFGPTTAYGQQTAVQLVLGLAPTSASTTFSGLRPYTTYHYRAVATSADGATRGPDQTFITRPVTPALTGLLVKPATRRITYTDSEPASTTIAISRCVSITHHRCTRYRRTEALTHKDRSGANSLRLPKLPAGRYRLAATPHIGALTGRTLSARFGIS